MPRLLASVGLVAAASLFGVFGSGCYATVHEHPHYVQRETVVWVDGPPVEDVAIYPYRDYYGTRVYWVNGFWYYRESGRWAYYATEPNDLYVYRTTYVSYGAPEHHHHPHHEAATVHTTTHTSSAPQHHASSAPAQQPAQPATPAKPTVVTHTTKRVPLPATAPVSQPSRPSAAPPSAPPPASVPKKKTSRKSPRLK